MQRQKNNPQPYGAPKVVKAIPLRPQERLCFGDGRFFGGYQHAFH